MKNTPKSTEPIIERQVPPAGLQGAMPAPTPGAAAVRGAGAARKRKSELDALVASDQDEAREVNARDVRSEEVGELIAQASTPAPAPAPAVPVEPIGALPSSATGALMAAPTAAAGAAAVTTTAASSGGFSPILAGLGGLAALGGGGGGGSNSPATIGGVGTGAVFASSNTATPAVVTASLTVTDPDANQSFFAAVPSGSLVGTYGNFTFNSSTGAWTYTVNNNLATTKALGFGQTGSDSLTVTSIDGTATRVIVAVVNGSNDGPVANNDSGSTDEDTAVTINVLANDTDVDTGTTLVVTGASANNGTVVIGAGGALTYTPAANFNGTDQITYTISDGNGGTSTAQVIIAVAAVNDPAGLITGAIDGILNESVNGAAVPAVSGALTVTDVDNTGFSTTLVSGPSNGTASVTTGGVWTYTVNTGAFNALNVGQSATDTFVVKSADGTSSQTVTVVIQGQNDSATAISASTATQPTEASGAANATAGVNGAGSASVTDADNTGFMELADGGISSYGQFSLNASTGNWVYYVDNSNASVQALNAGTSLADSIVLYSADGTASTTITVVIAGANDNSGPITGQISGTALEAVNAGASASISGVASVLDVDNTGFSTVVTGASNGVASITTGGVWTYTLAGSAFNSLNVGASATDSFVVKSADGTSSQTITVVIQGQNDSASIGAAGATINATEAGGANNGTIGLVGQGAVGAVTDIDNTGYQPLMNGGLGTYGEFQLNTTTGAWIYVIDNADAAVQALNVGASLSDSIVAYSADGTASQTITVLINGANDNAGPITGQISGTVNESIDSAVVAAMTASGTVAVSDVDNTGFSTTLVTAASSGTASITSGGVWTYTVNAGAFNTLNVGQSATDTFVVKSADGTSSQTVTVVIQGQNDSATIGAAGVTINATEASGANNATAGTVGSGGVGAVTDADNTGYQPLLNGGLGTYGQFTLNTTSGAWVYVIDNAHASVQALNTGASLSDSVVAYSADGTASQTITVLINGANDNAGPITGQISGTVNESIDSAVVAAMTASGTVAVSDVDNTGFSTTLVTAASSGTASITSGGVWTYTVSAGAFNTLNVGQSATDTFVVKSADGTSSQTVTVVIQGQNDSASIVAGGNTASLTEASGAGNTVGGGNAANTLSAVTDADNTGYQAFLTAPGANGFGTFTLLNNGQWSYSVNQNNATVQALNTTLLKQSGATSVVDTIVAFSADGTASQLITATINGANDNATAITGTVTGVALAQGTAPIVKGGATATTATGVINASDIDNTGFDTLATVGTFGTFAWTPVGNAATWVYTPDATKTANLAAGQQVTDSILVKTFDGTVSQVVSVTVVGANDQATIAGATTGAVTEAGSAAAAGANVNPAAPQPAAPTYVQGNSGTGTPAVSGTLTVTDLDNASTNFVVVSAPLTSNMGYGSYTMTSGGLWTYTLNDSNSAVQALNNGGTLVDNFVVFSSDGTASQQVSVTINGKNDAATNLFFQTVLTAVENGSATPEFQGNNDLGRNAFGYYTVDDVDSGNVLHNYSFGTNGVLPPGEVNSANSYGRFYANNNTGSWGFRVDQANATIQALNVGQSATDSFTYFTADGTASATVTVTIFGANDNAVITTIGGNTGNASEASGALNATPGTTATNTISGVTDVDNPILFAAQTNVAGANGYGKFTVNGAGSWSYTVTNTNAAVQALNTGASLQDTLTVLTTDGTVSVVLTATINGANDNATAMSSTVSQDAVEAGSAVGTAVYTAPGAINYNSMGGFAGRTATGFVSVTDVDNTGVAAFGSKLGANGYGTFVVGADGTWTYTVLDSNATVQALNLGQSLQDTTVVTSADGTFSTVVTATIIGANDAAVVAAVAGNTGSATEASGALNATAGATATGTITGVSDVDNTALFAAQTSAMGANGYGMFTVNSAGSWSYTVTDTNAAVQALNTGGTLQDTLLVLSTDGTASVVLTATINGANDNATAMTITTVQNAVEQGSAVGSAVGGSNFNSNGGHAGQAASGTITVADVDNTGVTAIVAGAGLNGYGTFTVNADGSWSYAANDTLAAVKELNVGQTLADSIVVTSADGTFSTTLTATIMGANDQAAAVTSSLTATISEASGANNGTGVALSTATGTFTFTDEDAPADTSGAPDEIVAQVNEVTTYGSFTIGTDGKWTYTVNNSNAAVQALNEATFSNPDNSPVSALGTTLVDTVTIQTVSGGTLTLTVTVTIQGKNDNAGAISLDGIGVLDGSGSLVLTSSTTSIQVLELASGTGPLAKDSTGGNLLPDPSGNGNMVTDFPNTYLLAADGSTYNYGAGKYTSGTQSGQFHSRTFIRGQLSVQDVDNIGFYVDSTLPDYTTGGTPSSTYRAQDTAYGLFELYQNGQFRYTAKNNQAEVQALNNGATLQTGFNETLVDTVTVYSADKTSTLQFTFTIHGQNDSASILSTVSTFHVYELFGNNNNMPGIVPPFNTPIKGDGTYSATATVSDHEQGANIITIATTALTVTDDDNRGFSAITSGATYGSFTYDTATGQWTYQLNNSNPDVQALNSSTANGGNTNTLTDSTVIYSYDLTASTTLTVVIHGNNDAGTISGAVVGTITEGGISGIAAQDNLPSNVILNPGAGINVASVLPRYQGAGTPLVNDVAASPAAVSGALTITDVDNKSGFVGGSTVQYNYTGFTEYNEPASGPTVFTTSTVTFAGSVTAQHGQFGKWDFNVGTGVWTYDLFANHAEVQALNVVDADLTNNINGVDDATLTDTLTLVDKGGSSHTIVVTITGRNDEADPISGSGLTKVDGVGASSTVTVAVDTAVAANNITAIQAYLQEAGGTKNGNAGIFVTASGTLSVFDIDNDDKFAVVGDTVTATDQATYSTVTKTGTFGKLSFNEDTGAFTYALTSQTNTTIQALKDASATVTDNFTISSADGTATRVLSIVIAGQDDFQTIVTNSLTVATTREAGNDTINGQASGNTPVFAPAGPPTWYGHDGVAVSASGSYKAADVDSLFSIGVGTTSAGSVSEVGFVGANGWSVSENGGNVYGGTLTLGYTGSDVLSWSFDVDNADIEVQALNVGDSATLTFTFTTPDGKTSATQTVTIFGYNDKADPIAGALAGGVTEASGAANAVPGTPTATGTATVVDIDNLDEFQTSAVFVSSALVGGPTFNSTSFAGLPFDPNSEHGGTFSIGADGKWTYTMDNTNTTVQSLNAGQSIQATYRITSLDGTATETVIITITGADDFAGPIAATGTDTLATEAGGPLTNTTPALAASGALTASDVDNKAGLQFDTVLNTGATSGVATVSVDGKWVYTPNAAAFEDANVGDTRTDTFTVKTADGNETFVVTVTINGTNDHAGVIGGDLTGGVTEASGVLNATPGIPSATGTVTVVDVDNDDTFLTTATFVKSALTGGPTFNSTQPGGLTFNTGSQYGTYTIAADGKWTYTVDNANTTVQSLNVGQSIETTYLVKSVDGTSSQTVVITITGADDSSGAIAATGTDTASTEAGGAANGTPQTLASGQVTVSDVDNKLGSLFSTTLQTAATSGTATISAGGIWNYTPDAAAFESLNTGDSTTDTFTIKTADGAQTFVVTVTVNGLDDDSTGVTFNAATGAVTEVGNVAGNTTLAGHNANFVGTHTITGTYTVSDVDNLGDTATTSVGTYGTLVLSSPTAGVGVTNGDWTYTVNTALNDAVDQLKAGQTLVDTLVVTSADGLTSASLTITINGIDDAPYAMTKSGLATVIEIGDTAGPNSGTPISVDPFNPALGVYNTAKISFTDLFEDVDTLDSAYTFNFIGHTTSPYISNVTATSFDLLYDGPNAADGKSVTFNAVVGGVTHVLSYTVAAVFP